MAEQTLPDDFLYYRDAAKLDPSTTGGVNQLKHEITKWREPYRAAGVIIELNQSGTGERAKVLISLRRRLQFHLDRSIKTTKPT